MRIANIRMHWVTASATVAGNCIKNSVATVCSFQFVATAACTMGGAGNFPLGGRGK